MRSVAVHRSERRVNRLVVRAGRTPTASGNALEQLEPRQLLAFDPTPTEQYMLELLNRIRTNPAAELGLLTNSLATPARSSDPDVDSALRFFNVDGTVLQQQWGSLTAAAPLAWNENLYLAAEGHNQKMIAGNVQSHKVVVPAQGIDEPDLGARATAAGYTNWSNLGENIYAYGRSVLHAHAGFAIDWGSGVNPESGLQAVGGIQNPPGHRQNMMDPTYREVGIRITTVNDPGNSNDVGPLVITQDFGKRFNQSASALLGVVYGDTTSNGYSIGEGFGGVTVTAVGLDGTAGAPTFTTTSLTAGGWQLQLPAGTYAVTFSGGGFGAAVTYHGIAVGAQNVKLDAVKGVQPPAPDAQVWANSMRISAGDTSPTSGDFTDFGNANRDSQSITKQFQLYNAGTLTLNMSGSVRVKITGANAGDFTLLQDVSATLGAGGRSDFQIRFDPSAVGLRTATVTIMSNDPDSPSYAFSIQGRGVRRAIASVSGKQVVIVNGDTTPTTADWTNFGGVNVESASKVRIFTITNTGLSDLTFQSGAPVTLSGPGAKFFQVLAQPSGTVVPGGTVQFRVRFAPNRTGTGFQDATISLASSDLVTPTYSFSIRGNGLMLPHAVVVGNNAVILSGDTTPSMFDRTDFGTVNVASGNRVRQFIISNSGLGLMTLTGSPRVVISGPNASDFVVSLQPDDFQIYTGETQIFRVRFDPTAIGFRTATITIASNDPAGAFTFAIGGTGT